MMVVVAVDSVSEPSTGVGANYRWADGEMIGTGSITILE
jgi:hypothetical protein